MVLESSNTHINRVRAFLQALPEARVLVTPGGEYVSLDMRRDIPYLADERKACADGEAFFWGSAVLGWSAE